MSKKANKNKQKNVKYTSAYLMRPDTLHRYPGCAKDPDVCQRCVRNVRTVVTSTD